MCSRLVAIVGVTLLLLLNGAVASADDPSRVVLSRVDAADFPTVRLVASVLDLKGADPEARRAIVLLTDGFDTASRSSRELAIARLAGSGFPMYTIGLGSSIDRQTIEALAAAAPGGAAYVAPTSSQLAGIYNALSEQILTEYSVEYRSAATGLADGSAVAFEIVVSREGVIIARTTSSFLIPAGRGVTK